MENKKARNKFLREIKDASVEFLLSYLPTMEIKPIKGEKDGVEYKLWDIDLSGFKIVSDHVSVDFDEQNMELLVTARKLSCQMRNLGWHYKQLKFPYFSGKGKADADMKDAVFCFRATIEFITKEEADKRKREIEEREKDRKRKLLEEKLKKQRKASFATAGKKFSLKLKKPKEEVKVEQEDKEDGKKVDQKKEVEAEAVEAPPPAKLTASEVDTKPTAGSEEKLILQVTLKDKKMEISELALCFDTGFFLQLERERERVKKQFRYMTRNSSGGGASTWFYNKVAAIFKESIRWYVEDHLNKSLDDYSSVILDMCNKYAQQYYLPLLNILKAAKKGMKESKMADKIAGKKVESEKKVETTTTSQ